MGCMADHFAPGAVVCGGRFRIVRVLAVGGMGSVYDVEDVSIGKRFVLKTLNGELATEGDLRRQMQREARVMGRIDHPNVVRVFTAGVIDDALALPFIVMEKLEGASLRQVIRAGTRLSPRAAVRVAIDLLHALDHVHEIGVVHCDIKPENVFLHVERGVVVPKLLDFGVVRVLARGEANAKLGGTLRYASPEQVLGEAVGPRSDVYAMALVLYEMLAGRSPFHDVSGVAKIARAQLERIPPRIGGITKGLMDILLRALAKAPKDRPRDAFELARDLQEIEAFLGPDATIAPELLRARATCDEATRVGGDDTVVDLTQCLSNKDLLTRYASGDAEGGGGRCEGFLP